MERDEITADMMPVLDQFAREYNRVLELELDDLGNTDVVSTVSTGGVLRGLNLKPYQVSLICL